QESLRNAYRHANGRELKVEGFGDATSVTITTSCSSSHLPSDAPDGLAQDLGLRGVRQRVESIGGTIEILSPPGKGTQLRMRLPYSMAEVGDDAHM
ncbi:hypothetical protein ABTM18_19355, partial [Acinetobacter baumannii]